MALSHPHVSTPSSRPSAPPPVRLDRGVALQAGALLLLIAVVAGVGYVGVIQGLVTDGDAARTAADISASRGLFALGVAALFVAALLDLLVAWALFRFFEPVDPQLSRLAAYLRVAYTAVFLAALGQLTGVLRVLDDESGAFSTEQVQALALGRIETFHDIWFAGLVLCGAHLAVLGLLVLRSRAVHRALGVLLLVAGAGYVFDTFLDLYRPGLLTVTSVTFVGEFLLALWLVARAGRAVRGGGLR